MDSATVKESLTPVLTDVLEGFKSLKSCDRLTGGASQETWRLTLDTDAGESCLCLRRNRGAVGGGGEDNLGPSVEARLMQAAADVGIPEPKIFHVLDSGGELGYL